ncbi:NOC3p-domain-containing protein [Pholiota conissans]|uniref:Nucleolar complex-associated protein 3 n=1 Tax=Pholiota conissans TaxID=109636 RepID=A0A9P5Z2C2_9AGAR|nr:NOC3p-domain-containing protein [Pholiota conissans]
MAGNLKGKRPASSSQASSKKRKLNDGKQKSVRHPSTRIKGKDKEKEPKRERLADSGKIPIPNIQEDDVELSDQDLEFFEEFGGSAVGFLNKLDRNGIMRSKKETLRLHELTKPERKHEVHDDLPSLNSDDESWDSELPEDMSELPEDMSELPEDMSELSGDEGTDGRQDDAFSQPSDDSNEEMPYETVPRKQRVETDKPTEVERLPIKLANGKFLKTGTKTVTSKTVVVQEESSEDESEEEEEPQRVEDVATGARFGRPAVVYVLQTKSRKRRIEMAKDQIAGICQEIMADTENSLGLLRRLHTFASHTVTTPANPEPVPNDPIVRKLAVLSQLAIFKDIIPGYRIRALTDIEKAEKVSQMVARTRDWEQGLVVVYQAYLRLLEKEMKVRSELTDVALHCMCILLSEVTHFNFRVNLMTAVVSHLSKKSWDKSSELCSKTLIGVFRADLTGEASLEIVRLVNRMVKERHFKVHPNVLSCLLHLRLRTELGVRASSSHADKPEGRQQRLPRHMKPKKAEPVHLSKKAKKAYKEQKEINKELQEAGAEVDKEERKTIQTETLKLLFALYFRILKNPTPSPLLPAALSGISRFAHLVNIDFFKDLMAVLKDLIVMEEEYAIEHAADLESTPMSAHAFQQVVVRQLMCIVTAFELLSGQGNPILTESSNFLLRATFLPTGDALNIDLSAFITQLYSMLLSLTFSSEIDAEAHAHAPSASRSGPTGPSATLSSSSSSSPSPSTSVIDMLFRALNLIFSPRSSGTSAPPWRSAAFGKRLLTASLHWPPRAALRALDFVGGLVAKDSKLEAMLATEDRVFNGVYRADVDDPQLSNPFGTSFFELHVLHTQHWDARVRAEAGKLLNFKA